MVASQEFSSESLDEWYSWKLQICATVWLLNLRDNVRPGYQSLNLSAQVVSRRIIIFIVYHSVE